MIDTQALFPQLHGGEIYDPGDEAMIQAQLECQQLLYQYNATRPDQGPLRRQLLEQMLAEAGENCWVEPPMHANWGGRHVHLGKHVYANFNLTLVDDTHITIGDYTMIGPNVVIATGGHTVLPSLRQEGYQYNAPVHIGKNCWLGAGVIVLPGVTIGDGTVVGAGSVVTHDLPAGVVAVGSPCRVLRPVNDHDRAYYWKDRPVPPEAWQTPTVID